MELITWTKCVYFMAEFRIAAVVGWRGGRERYLSNRVYRGDIGGSYNENTNTGSFGFYVKSGPIVCITKNKIVFRTRNTVNDRDGPVAGVIFCVIMVNENNNKKQLKIST